MMALLDGKNVIWIEGANECVVRSIEDLKQYGFRLHSIRIWNKSDIYPTFHFFGEDTIDFAYLDDHWEMIGSDGVGFTSDFLRDAMMFLSLLNASAKEIDFDLIKLVYGLKEEEEE